MMPGFEVDTKERKRAERLLEFVKAETSDVSIEGRFVFVIEAFKWFEPEIKELKRKAEADGR